MSSPQQKKLTNPSRAEIVKNPYSKRKIGPNVPCNEEMASDSKRFRNDTCVPGILESHEGGLLLWDAINKDDHETAKMLVRAGADLTLADPGWPEEKRNFLHSVAVKGQEKLALLMLEHGAQIDARDAEGKSVLYYAVQNNLLRLVEELVRRNAVVLDSDDEYNSTTCVLTLLAGKFNPRQLLDLLVFSCKDDDERNKRAGIIAEFYFVGGDICKLKMLLSRGLAVDYTGTDGHTMLHRAIIALNIHMVKLLLDHGANANQLITNDVSPLQIALIWHRSDLSTMLIEKGADIHAVDIEGRGPLHVACNMQSARYVNLLLQLRADVNVVDKNGRTPFSSMACVNPTNSGESHMIEQFAVLITSGRSINASDFEIIQSNVAANNIFKRCLKELNDMKETIVIDNISYFSILSKSSIELFRLARNQKFLEALKIKSEQSAKLFPTYFQRIMTLMNIAQEKQKLLGLVETHLTSVFDDILPQVVIYKIASYCKLDEINSMEKKYYLTLRKEMKK